MRKRFRTFFHSGRQPPKKGPLPGKGAVIVMKKVTVKDIARASGYSISTVSKTLNGTDRVGPDAARKIRQIARDMGYRSSFAAQSLVRGGRRVAIVLFDNPSEVRQLFEDGFRAAFDLYREFQIEPWYLLYDISRDSGVAEISWDRIESEADALIVIPGGRREDIEPHLRRIGDKMPLVMLQSRYTAAPDLTRTGDVTVHARAAGAMAAQFLSLCGSRKAALITGRPHAWIHEENTAGFLDAARLYGLRCADVAESFDEMETAYRQTASMLEQYPDLDGIFTSSYVAPGVCRRVRETGRRIHVVGTDLVAGSDDCLRDGVLTATIFQNQATQARLAAEMVVRIFREGGVHTEKPVTTLVKPELVLSSSLCCYTGSDIRSE